MRNHLLPLISSYVLLLNASYAQQNLAFPAEVLNRPLNQIQFKATHNSYQFNHRPVELIDDYNVWELELDFGVPRNSSEFIVGHNCPEDNDFGLRSLRDWILNAKSANSRQYHPIILKLEAKTRDSCADFDPFCDWCWDTVDKWRNWQTRLTDELRATIEEKNWVTQDTFKMNFNSTWPSARRLAGKFIVMLIDNNGGKDIQDKNSPYFFFGDLPELRAWSPKSGEWRPIKNAADFGYALKENFNRLIMDDGYKEPWSNVLVHSPLPSAVNSLHKGWQWGTAFQPFQTIGHAINASWMHNGGPTTQIIALNAGNYDEKVTISTPVEFRTPLGSVTIGGKNVAYTITLSVMDVADAGTNSPVYMHLRGANGSTGDYLLKNPKTYFDRAGAETFWITAADVGVLQSITIGVQGDDDVYIDDIIVVSATTGRKAVHAGAWIGNDNGSPKTFNF